ncbi:MFS transporter [Numidum massiliense]|uniref:MFS transporter n=1 Tax=Numidum massiliense TaxID=1522315 RepID=UPI0028FC9D62|nr:MFS transporter [Numidum massiliense]
MLILANLFTFMSFQMLVPTVPPYLQQLGGSEIAVGLATTLFSIAAVVIRPLIGFILESQTRKKLVLSGSVALLIVTVCYALFPLVGAFLLLRFVHGIAWGWATTSNGTAAVDLVPTKRIGEGMGYYGLSITLGMIIAPSLGIYVYQHYPFEQLIVVAAILGVIALGLFVATTFQTPESVTKNELSIKSFSFFGSLIEKNSLFPALVTLITTFGYGAIVTFIVIFSEEKQLDKVYLFYLCNAIAATVVRPITGKWFDRRGPWSLTIVCAVLAFLGMWALALAENNGHLILSGVLFGLGYGSMLPAIQAWILARTTREKSGIANGMFYSAIDFGIGISALAMGALKPFVGTAALFEISSFFFLGVIVLMVIDYRRQKQEKKTSKA